MRPEGREQSELDRLRLRLPGRQRHGQPRSATTAWPATSRTRPPAVCRRCELLRGDQRQGHRRRLGFHRLDQSLRRRKEDHQDAVDPDRASQAMARPTAAADSSHPSPDPPSGARRVAVGGRAIAARLRNPWPDHRAERTLGAVSLLVCACVVSMVVFVAIRALADVRAQRPQLARPGRQPQHAAREHAGDERRTRRPPSTTCAPGRSCGARSSPPASRCCLGIAIAVLSSIFIVELAPARLRRVAVPVIRLLASVPSVIYGLIGVLVLVPFVGNDLITTSEKESVQNVVQLSGYRPAGHGRDPDGDDHADHDRADLRGARLGARLLARGRGGAGRQPDPGDSRGYAARDPPGDRRGGRARERPSARRGGDDPDGLRIGVLRAQADRRPRRSSSSRCARSPRRSSTTTKGSARRPCARRSTRSRCCCSSPPSRCRSAAIWSSCRCASTRCADERYRPPGHAGA